METNFTSIKYKIFKLNKNENNSSQIPDSRFFNFNNFCFSLKFFGYFISN